MLTSLMHALTAVTSNRILVAGYLQYYKHANIDFVRDKFGRV